MNRQTIAALNRINRTFYHHQSEDFSRTRRSPWPGWKRVVSAYEEKNPTSGAGPLVSILDVGCGNGRFLPFLAEHSQAWVRYFGVDSSLALLLDARGDAAGRTSPQPKLVAAELIDDRPLEFLRSAQFDLAVVFGVLHHIPSYQARQSLLTALAACLTPGGVMAVSFWQFGEHRRFLRQSMSWTDYNKQAREPIEIGELEKGDMVLTWGDQNGPERVGLNSKLRYCHFADANEAGQLVGSLPLRVMEMYHSDGEGQRQNLYYLLER